MPRKPNPESLEAFVRRQDAAVLSDLLIELAADHPPVQDRLVRMQLSSQPKALAAEFRKTLAAWRRSTRFLGYSEAGAFGRERSSSTVPTIRTAPSATPSAPDAGCG